MADKPFAVRLQVILECVLLPPPCAGADAAALELRVQDERKIACVHREPTIAFAPKSFHPPSHAGSLWRRAGAHGQRTDGLLFTDRTAPMAVGRTDAILKWKPHHTVDVALRRRGAEEEEEEGEEEEGRGGRTRRRSCRPRGRVLAAHAGGGARAPRAAATTATARVPLAAELTEAVRVRTS